MDKSTTHHLNKIVSRRSTSGVIVFDSSGDILYLNQEARSLLFNSTSTDSSEENPSAPTSNSLLDLIKDSLVSISAPMSKCIHYPGGNSTSYAIRALPLHKPQKEGKSCILVLIEGVTIHRKFDMKEVKKQFGLSKRETEVTLCLTKGLTNKEIANVLFISPETVHGYIKQIMKKLSTTTRAGIVGKILP